MMQPRQMRRCVSLVLLVGVALWSAGLAHGQSPAADRAEQPDRAADPSLSGSAARAWAVGGWTFLGRGDARGAQQAFLAAAEAVPREAVYWVGLGLSWHRAGRDGQAQPALERALALDPHVGQAHKLLGDILERQGEVGAAAAHFEIALRQDPADVDVKERLLGLRRAVQFEATLDRLYSRHVTVAFDGADNRALALEIARQLDRTADEVGRRFGYVPQAPIVALLYPPDRFRSVTGSPSWAGGLFDGRLHLPTERLRGSDESRQALLTHEYAHAVVHRLSGGRAPMWLQEGLARYCEAPAGPGPAMRATSDETWRQAERHFLGDSPRAAARAYDDSERQVRALVKKHGLEKMRRLLAALPEATSFEEAYAAVLGEPFAGRLDRPAAGDARPREAAVGGQAG